MKDKPKYDPDKSRDITKFAKGAFVVFCLICTLALYIMKRFNIHNFAPLSWGYVFSPILIPIFLTLVYILIMILYMIIYVWIAPKFQFKKNKDEKKR